MIKISQMEPWIGKEEKDAVDKYLDGGGWLTEFKKTEEFEEMIAKFVGSRYASVVSNGTVSLFIALSALGINEGDEVLIPDLTMIATANTVLLSKGKPILVDIDPITLCMDLAEASKKITKRTKALVYVSLNGRSGDMKQLIAFCKENNLFLVEDAAQSLGSKWKGKHLGTFGLIGSFSFSAPKIITTGQGGALVTYDPNLIKKIEEIKDFGRERTGIDKHISLGYNFKFTDLQAVIGIEQMKKLDFRIKRKKEMFKLYQKELSNISEIEFVKTDLSQTSPWFIDIFAYKRDELIDYLAKEGIGSRPFYPPVHTQAPYNNWEEYKNSKFSVSEKASNKGLWLPSSTFISDSDIIQICQKIKSFYAKN